MMSEQPDGPPASKRPKLAGMPSNDNGTLWLFVHSKQASVSQSWWSNFILLEDYK